MTLKRTSIFVLLAAAVICMFLVLPAFGDDEAQAGRQTVSKYQDAVITVQLVISTSMSMEGAQPDKKEDKVETTGTIVDPSGLAVVSLASIDPTEAMSRMMPEEMKDLKITSNVTDCKIMLGNGQLLPASVVLRDKDLDLAFIRPKQKPAQPLTAVDFNTSTKPGLLDQTLILYRYGTVGSRSLAACLDRVQSIIEKPRTFYALGLPAMGATLGAPVFAMDTNIVGLLLLRTVPGGMTDSASSTTGLGGEGIMYVVLPAADVLAAAKQAP